jgi:hypothetical protein
MNEEIKQLKFSIIIIIIIIFTHCATRYLCELSYQFIRE